MEYHHLPVDAIFGPTSMDMLITTNKSFNILTYLALAACKGLFIIGGSSQMPNVQKPCERLPLHDLKPVFEPVFDSLTFGSSVK